MRETWRENIIQIPIEHVERQGLPGLAGIYQTVNVHHVTYASHCLYFNLIFRLVSRFMTEMDMFNCANVIV